MAYHFHQVLVLWLKGITFKRPLPPPCFSWPYAYLLLSFYKGIIFLCKAHKSYYSSPMLESTSLTRCLGLGLRKLGSGGENNCFFPAEPVALWGCVVLPAPGWTKCASDEDVPGPFQDGKG